MTPINLENTSFELKEMVHHVPSTLAFKGEKLRPFQDFGTVFIGTVPDEDKEMSIPQPGAPTFTAPENWRMPQLLRALGAFKSASAAAKNGWDMDIPEGCSSFVVKINKVKGEIWIHKKVQQNVSD